MTLSLTIFWIVIISLFSALGAYYAKRFNQPDGLIALYVAFIVFSNIAASKTISFDLGFTQVFAPGAVLIFGVTFLLTDIVNEKFGRGETRRMILIAFVAQIAITLFSYLVVKATPAPFYNAQEAFALVIGNVPRLVGASLIAFFISENVDAYLFHWFKTLTGEKRLWLRNAFSSIPAMLVDSTIFVSLAFYGTLPIGALIFGLTLTKWLVAIVNIPFMYLAHWIMEKHTA